MIGTIRILGWLVPLSLVHGAIVALAVWLALRILPLDRARLRHAVAVGGLVIAVGSLVSTAGILLVDWNAHVACWTSEAGAVTAECRSHGVPVRAGAEPADKMSAVLVWELLGNTLSVPLDRTMALAWTNVAGIFGAVWLGIVLLLGLREARLRRVVHDLRRSSSPIRDGTVERLLADLRAELAIDVAIDIRESRRVATPCVIGTGPATILLPAGLRSVLQPPEIRGILAHELAHVRWKDARTLGLERAATALLFFNPFAAWIARRARQEREAACDHVGAAAASGSRADYARALLLLEGFRAAPPATASVPALLGEGDLALRVKRLIAGPRRGRTRRSTVFALAVAAALMMTTLAQVTLAGASLGSWAVMAADERYDDRSESM